MNQCNKCSLFSFYSFLTLPKPHHAKCILNQFYLHYDKLFCKTNPANKLSYFHGAVIRAAHEKKNQSVRLSCSSFLHSKIERQIHKIKVIARYFVTHTRYKSNLLWQCRRMNVRRWRQIRPSANIFTTRNQAAKKTVVNFVEWLKSQWNVTNEPTGYMLKLKLKHTIHQASAKMKMKTNNRDKNNELLLHLYNSNEKKEEKKERHIHKQNDGDIVCHSNKRMTGRWTFFSSVILSLLLLYLSLRDYFCATNDIYSFYRLQCFCTNCLGDFFVVDKNKINDRRMNDTHLTLTTVVDNSVRFTMNQENWKIFCRKKNNNMKQERYLNRNSW